MKILLLTVGRLKKGPETLLYERYAERIRKAGKAVGIGPVQLLEIAESQSSTAQLRCASEGEKLIELSAPADFSIALDEGGKSMNSRAFAELLRQARDDGCRSVAFLVGGADGHGPAIEKNARFSLTLGRLTLPHGLARVVLTEQIYRAITIMSGHPYHRD